MSKKSKTPIIRIHGLSWTYPKSNKTILNHVDLELNKGDFCFVVGKSGEGKTTLTKFILRQLKPPKGTIFHHRDDIARYSSREIQKYRSSLGVVFQDCKLLDWKTVKENISYPLEIDGIGKKEINKRVEEVTKLLDIYSSLDLFPATLSGGEKQRVAIARALIRNPEFLIADEPTGNIDEATSREIAQRCIDINKQGTTILFVTHDTKLIEYVQKKHPVRIITLGKGAIDG